MGGQAMKFGGQAAADLWGTNYELLQKLAERVLSIFLE